mmetsp:Transcript_51637/g.122900  ORF Transcript_51637/g.122900 Transcript_51637/m.122900 type:complete len:349 (-) Transcript_51637:10-1056(-)
MPGRLAPTIPLGVVGCHKSPRPPSRSDSLILSACEVKSPSPFSPPRMYNLDADDDDDQEEAASGLGHLLGSALIKVPEEKQVEHNLLSSAVLTTETASPCELVGDYHFRTPDGQSSSTLRLKDNGQWWHAAHRMGHSNGERVWEMAECLGSWREVSAPSGRTLALVCEGPCRWTSQGPEGSLALRPSSNLRLAIEDLVDNSRLVMTFLIATCEASNQRCLTLETNFHGAVSVRQEPSRRLRAAGFTSLGFSEFYEQECVQILTEVADKAVQESGPSSSHEAPRASDRKEVEREDSGSTSAITQEDVQLPVPTVMELDATVEETVAEASAAVTVLNPYPDARAVIASAG